jgi:putative SOS response-associated peptidase YedK
MCGRFVMISDLSAIKEAFDIQAVSADVKPSYNIAPGSEVAALVHDRVNRLVSFRWGLVPSWAKNPTIEKGMINARAETVAEKPSFRDSFKKRRCLVLANGYYEWKKVGRNKVPHYVYPLSERPFGFAGLCDTWRSKDGERLSTCTIITTEPNELLRPLHDRMPVIVPKDRESLWLDNSVAEEKSLLSMLRASVSEALEVREVSTLVNSPLNDVPECIQPLSSGLL